MAVIVVGGDCATTTTMAIAAGWPHGERRIGDVHQEVVVVEADPSGGSLAAWLDSPLSPSLTTVVTALHQGVTTGANPLTQWSTIDVMIRRSASGLQFVPAPFRSREARGAISEADLTFFPLLGSVDHTIALLDVGRIDPLRLPTSLPVADLTVVVHRQDSSSAPAATVRLERLAETLEALRDAGQRVALGVIGDEPFSLSEVVEFTAPNGPAWTLSPDPLSAAVLAGHAGVSRRRLARLPLMRSTAHVAADLDRLVTAPMRASTAIEDPRLAEGGVA